MPDDPNQLAIVAVQRNPGAITPLRESDDPAYLMRVRDPDYIRSRLDYSTIVAYPIAVMRTVVRLAEGSVIERLLGGPAGVILTTPNNSDREPEDSFEAWCVAQWLSQLRSEAFRDTADYEHLRGQWEREG